MLGCQHGGLPHHHFAAHESHQYVWNLGCLIWLRIRSITSLVLSATFSGLLALIVCFDALLLEVRSALTLTVPLVEDNYSVPNFEHVDHNAPYEVTLRVK